MNQDPIGIAGGLNVYAFAGLSPVNVADPMGLIPLCSKVITYNDGKVVGEEYNWQGCEWIFDLIKAMTNMQAWGWMALGGLGMPGGLNPFDGGAVGGGTGRTGATGTTGQDDEEDHTERTPQECFEQSIAPVSNLVSDFQGEILAGSFAIGVRATAGSLLQVRGSQVAAYHGMRVFGTRSRAPFPSMRSLGGALLRSAAQGLVTVGGVTAAYLGTTLVVCRVAPGWL